jgi:hypothetical protein
MVVSRQPDRQRRRPRWERLLTAVAVAGLLIASTACGAVRASGSQPPASPAASTTGRSGSRSSTQASARAGPTAGTQLGGGPVPPGFAATSVTFVSADEAFVLGTARCAHAPCTSILRTLNRGASWIGLPAPPEPVGQAGLTSTPVAWGIRFATPEHGFVFGDGLWETTDGGARWTRATTPVGSILSLAIVRGQVLVLAARCPPDSGCGQTGILARRPLSGGPWTGIAKDVVTNLTDPDDLIATQAGIAAAIIGRDVLVTRDGGFTFTLNPIPCGSQSGGPSVAVISATSLAMLCTDGGYTGHTIKQVYVSDDAGSHWTLAGNPSPAGDAGTIAATATGRLAIATASAASWLFYSGNGGVSWQTVNEQYDGGAGWADLGFTTAAYGVVVHGPAVAGGQRPGQLFLTSDSGATWYPIRF